MIIVKLIDYLESTLDINVYTEQPEILTGYILLDQTGCTINEHIKRTTIAIQSYAPTQYEAMQMNEDVKAAMHDFVRDDDVTRVELETDYNFTNTVTKQHRWQAVYHIYHY